jgi:hypothetical protein
MMVNRNEQLKSDALRIIAAAEENKSPVRLLGGMAIYITSPCTQKEPYARGIDDLDFVVSKKKSYSLEKLLEKIGFEGDHEFNSIHGEYRLLFHSELMELDIFVGEFVQCHSMNLEKFIGSTTLTIPLANLLLTKLQVVQINKKDILDILALLHDHEVLVDGNPDDVISLKELNAILSDDWGWFTTCVDNLDKIQRFVLESINDPDKPMLLDKIDLIRSHAQSSKKSLKWTVRSKVGRKVQWYELPEEK